MRIYRGTKGKISIKTRIGRYSPDEFEEILRIYNQYPVEELIIHPRVQQDFYKNRPNLEVFARAMKESRIRSAIMEISLRRKMKSGWKKNSRIFPVSCLAEGS